MTVGRFIISYRTEGLMAFSIHNFGFRVTTACSLKYMCLCLAVTRNFHPQGRISKPTGYEETKTTAQSLNIFS
jgi:hypothetical protein